MTFIQHPDRRTAERFEKTLKVRFTINNGPEQTSDTINFTARSVAIRSDCPVKKHDKIVAYVDDLPEIKGSVIRVFDEGFAICLNDSSLALITHAGAEIPDLTGVKTPDEDADRILSPIFRIDAPAPAWGQITTARFGGGDTAKHFLSIVTTGAIDINDVHKVWVSIDGSRWTAQLIQSRRENNQAMFVILLNEWQLRMAAKDGISITILSAELKEWQARLSAGPIDAHRAALAPMPMIDLPHTATALSA